MCPTKKVHLDRKKKMKGNSAFCKEDLIGGPCQTALGAAFISTLSAVDFYYSQVKGKKVPFSKLL